MDGKRAVRVLVLGVRAPDHAVLSHSLDERFSLRPVEKLMVEVLDTVRALQINHIAGERLRWMFENAWVYYVSRPDGALAIVLVSNQEEVSPAVDSWLSQFQAG